MRKIVILTSLFVIPQSFAGEEKVINLVDVPDQLMQKIAARFPNVPIASANTEVEADGSYVYEIQGRIKAGQHLPGEQSELVDDDGDLVNTPIEAGQRWRNVEFDLTPEGDFAEIEVEFDEAMVPGAVMKALKAAYPGFKADFIEASYSNSMDVVGYEFSGTLKNRPLDLDVSASGQKITVADD